MHWFLYHRDFRHERVYQLIPSDAGFHTDHWDISFNVISAKAKIMYRK